MKMILRKFLVSTILTCLLPTMSFAAGGDSGTVGGGGGYAKRNALAVLKSVSQDLASTIRGLPQASFPKLPSGWNQNRIADIIQKIEADSTLLTQRDGDYLILDYDLKSEKIMALAPFFWIYGAIPEKKGPSSDQYYDIATKILHEVAHFWVGGDEDKADEFSDQLLKRISDHTMVLKCSDEFSELVLVNLSNGRALSVFLTVPGGEVEGIGGPKGSLNEKSGSSIHFTRYKFNSVDIDWELIGDQVSGFKRVIHFIDGHTEARNCGILDTEIGMPKVK